MVKKEQIPQAGIITLRNWLYTSNGDQSRCVWCKRWLLHTDKDMDLVGIKSSDRWAMIALDANGEVLAVIPGCEVTGYAVCKEPPPINAYVFGGKDAD